MGYMRHHAIVVTGADYPNLSCGDHDFGDYNFLQKAHEKASSIFKWVSPVSKRMTNGYASFFVPPDGSKEGWDESDEGDRERAQFLTWLEAQRFEDRSSPLDWVEVQYGDDEYETKVVNDNDALLRAEGLKMD